MTINLPLSRGLTASVDPWRADLIQKKWSAGIGYRGRAFAFRTENRKTVYLHRAVMSALPGEIVDHINGNTLDCTEGNLRIVSHETNCWNRGGATKSSKSGHLGVHFDHLKGRWKASITARRKHHNLGSFISIDEAITARLRAEADLWGVQPRRVKHHLTLDSCEAVPVSRPLAKSAGLVGSTLPSLMSAR